MGRSDLETLPPCEEYCFCKWLYEATQKYFEDPEVKARFEKWKKEREVLNRAPEATGVALG